MLGWDKGPPAWGIALAVVVIAVLMLRELMRRG